MSEDKKSFVLYTDYLEHFMCMSLEERGALFTAIFEYAKYGQPQTPLPSGVEVAFSFMRSQLERDNEKWLESKKNKSKAGKKGAHFRWHPDVPYTE